MATEVQVRKEEAQELDGAERTRTRRLFIPKVDIYETGEAVILLADMPGAHEDAVDITLEKNILSIKGYVNLEGEEGYGLAYNEYDVGDYERTFALSDEVNRNEIEAAMKDGVLQLTLPKAETARTRKIAVKAAS